MSICYIGIDPGASGGYAAIHELKAETFPWDNIKFCNYMADIESAYQVEFAVVEKVGAMPQNGSVSMFSFGKAAGFIEGVLLALCIPYQLVPPQKWKKAFSLGSDKAKSIEVCERLFPNVDLHRTERCTTKHDGMAEALLMAEYARRISGATQQNTALSQSIKER